MNGNAPKRTGILRAEIAYDDVQEVACALELANDSVFVMTDALPPIGISLDLRLSFPNAVDPIEVRGTVKQVRLASGPGTPSGFVAEFLDATEEQRARIDAVLERLASTVTKVANGNGGREISVLLVEDNRLVRDMFAYAVTKYFGPRAGRIRLEQAEDADDAWKKLHATRYDLVIVDYYLPTDDGASLISRVRGEPSLAGTSVVAISIGGSDVRRATLSAGADVFLHKPIVLRDLFHTLELLMQQEAADAGAA